MTIASIAYHLARHLPKPHHITSVLYRPYNLPCIKLVCFVYNSHLLQPCYNGTPCCTRRNIASMCSSCCNCYNLPIASVAHSFGIETLVRDGTLTVGCLEAFLHEIVVETGAIDAGGCRPAHPIARSGEDCQATWRELNARLAALRPARESRAAKATLDRRLFQLVRVLDEFPIGTFACGQPHDDAVDPQMCAAFR